MNCYAQVLYEKLLRAINIFVPQGDIDEVIELLDDLLDEIIGKEN